MFPINFNFPYRKKDGSLITMEKALDGAGADLDLIDLDDVAITNPADGDGLVYDATAQKWENVPIMIKEQWQKNGAYNQLPNNGTSLVQNGVTFTVNSDGTVTASTVPGSPASDNAGLYFFGTYSSYVPDNKNGVFKLVGSPSNAGCSILYIVSADGSTFDSQAEDTGNGAIITAKGYAKAYIRVAKNTDLSTPVTFKPMLTTDLNATYADYVPYAKTNRELTELADGISTTGATPNSTYVNTNDGYSFTIGKWGHFAILYAQFKTTSSVALDTEVTVATIPSGYRPKVSMAYSTYDAGYNSTNERHDVSLLNEKVNLTLRNQHNNSRWVSFTVPYICE